MIGEEIHRFAKILWPIHRSLTGSGVRETLDLIGKEIEGLKISSVASGTKAFDWIVPKEWKVNEAKIICPDGGVICDIKDNNLHLVGYSKPFKNSLTLAELENHLHSLPEQPQAVPYVTSYYKDYWGFCIADEQRRKLIDGVYQVVVDTELFDGVLNYAEVVIPGKSKEEILLSTYVCHPSMANNELSGPCVTTFLVKWLQEQKELKYTYRIVFVPETIGSITYLSKNLPHLKKYVVAGFNISCVGDERNYSYLPSRNGNTLSDRVALHVLANTTSEFKKFTWLDRGSDERQYCAPGIDLPIASIMRTKYGEYPEYHTSLDNLEHVVTPEGLSGGFEALRRAIELIEKNCVYSVATKCEPQMGRRGLYPDISSKGSADGVKLMMDVLSYCDGSLSVLEIAEILKVPAWNLDKVIQELAECKLIFATK